MIVVGVDHSEGAKEALRFAYEEARLRETPLRAVHAWRFRYIGAPGIESSVPVFGAELNEHRAVADAALAATVRETIPDVGEVTIEPRVAEGAAAAVLVEESRGAELLVVGSRGHGGFAQLLLGSVSQQSAQHAECPVAIVHPRSGRTG